MSIKRETIVARADMNDEFGVTVEQVTKVADYTVAEARELAEEILRAAAEAIDQQDRDAAWASEGVVPAGFDVDFEGVL